MRLCAVFLILSGLDALPAKGDALRRLRAEAAVRRGLPPPIDALLPTILDPAFKAEL